MDKKKIINYTLSFLCPVLILIIVLLLLNIYPFGNKDLLWFDTQAQYIDFLSYWQDVIRGQASIFYSFSKNLGGNMFGLFSYYLTSPINLIIMFFSKINLPQAFMLIILIKIGLCGITFRYYLNNSKFTTTNTRCINIKKLTFSTLYALIAYNIVFSMSHMWLDCVALLPLIFLGIEKIIYEKKWKLYLVSFTIAIIANYYIAFMIALFTIPYFIYILLCNNKNKHFKNIIVENKSNIWLYIRISFIAVFISGIILVPTIYSLMNSKAQSYNIESLNMYMYFDYLTLFSKNVLGAFSLTELREGAPNIYSGILTLILTILYFFNRHIEKKEKIYTGLLLFLFFICFYFNTINISLHMFQSPLSFPFRYSFIFSFIILILAYKCINNIDGVNSKCLIYITLSLTFIFILVDNNNYEYLVNWKIFITIILTIIYTVYISKISHFGIMGNISLYILICAELIINSFLLMVWMPFSDRNTYREHIQNYTGIYENIKNNDNGLYRIAYDNRRSSNDSLMYNFAGLEHYSSLGEKKTEKFLKSMGYEGMAVIDYGEGTLLDNSLLGVKYIVSTHLNDFYMNTNIINNTHIYKNQYALPIGYIVNPKILNYNNSIEYGLPFKYQNYIFGLMTGNEEKYYDIVNYELGEYNNILIKDLGDMILLNLIDNDSYGYIDFHIKTFNKPIYAYIDSDIRNGKVSYSISNTNINLTNSNITYIGNYENEITLRVTIYESGVNLYKNFLHYLNNELVLDELKKLSSKSLNVIEHRSNYIKGQISANNGEMLFTTIPYEKGWKVYLNGEEIEYEKALDTFILVPLVNGENILEFKYTSPGVIKGLVISIFGLIMLAVEIFISKFKKTKVKNNKTN